MTDREQAIKDVAENFGYPAHTVAKRAEDLDMYPTTAYAVAQRERVIQLERALREIAALNYATAATTGACYDAHRIARAALEGE